MAHDAPATVAELRDERLSAYLDGELPDGESAAVAVEIAEDPAMRADLEGLRLVRDGLRDLEVVPAPRSFALTAPPARPARWFSMPRLEFAMRTGAVAAAFAFAVVLVGDIGGTTVGISREASTELGAATASFSTQSGAAGAAIPRPTAPPGTPASRGETGGGAASTAASEGEPVGEATAERLLTADDSGADDGAGDGTDVETTTTADGPTAQPPTEGATAAPDAGAKVTPPDGSTAPPDAGGQVTPPDGATTLTASSTDSTGTGTSGDDSAPASGGAGLQRTAAPEDEATTMPPLTEDASTADEPAASPQPALASPPTFQQGNVARVSDGGGASTVAIALGALAALFTATSLVLRRRRPVSR